MKYVRNSFNSEKIRQGITNSSRKDIIDQLCSQEETWIPKKL